MWQRSDYFRSLTLGRLPLVNCFKGVTDRGKRFWVASGPLCCRGTTSAVAVELKTAGLGAR